jgi:hypothetical protein
MLQIVINIQSIQNSLRAKPRRLFLFDGLGALLSILFLGLILPAFETEFGMPAQVLQLLAIVACGFASYALACFRFSPRNWRPFLQASAIANLLYCGLTIGLVIAYRTSVTRLGFVYFALEVVVVVALSLLEISIIRDSKAAS